MTCASRVNRIERYLRTVHGVVEANINLTTETASVRYDRIGSIWAGSGPPSRRLVTTVESTAPSFAAAATRRSRSGRTPQGGLAGRLALALDIDGMT